MVAATLVRDVMTKVPDVLSFTPDTKIEDAARALSERRIGGAPVRAFLCMNDRLAFGAYQALAEAQLRIPEDVSVVSFDNDEIATYDVGFDHILVEAVVPDVLVAELAARHRSTEEPDQKKWAGTVPARKRCREGSLTRDPRRPSSRP